MRSAGAAALPPKLEHFSSKPRVKADIPPTSFRPALPGRVEKRGALASNNQPISRFVDILMLPKHCAEGGGVYRLLRSRCDSRWKIERHTSDLHMNQARGTCQVYQVRRDQCVLG
jgi:hypothetical protein